MNALDRNIEQGERLVILKERMRAEYQELPKRVFVAEGGFGTQAFTAGTKIFGFYECDNEHAYIRGNEISVEETEELQKVQKFHDLHEQHRRETNENGKAE